MKKTQNYRLKKRFPSLLISFITVLLIFNICHTVNSQELPSPDYPTVAPKKTFFTSSPTPSPSSSSPPLSHQEEESRKANREELAKKIESFLKNDVEWQTGKIGVFVRVLDGKEPVYSYNGNMPMAPASNLKVVTTACALSILGGDYQFETSVWGENPDPATGVMKGNLYLKGTGDPTWMEPFTAEPGKVLHLFAQTLKKKGVKVIEGDLVGDDSAFDREFLGRGWKTRYMLDEYAAPASALSINGNCVSVVMNKGVVSMLPGNNYIQIVNKATEGGGELYVDRKLGTDIITIKGGIPDYTVYRGITVNNPSRFTLSVFHKVLLANGITVKGKARLISETQDGDYTKNCQKLMFYKSPELKKIIKEINKESDNICAQHVFKAISHVAKGQGSCDNSNDVVKEWMTQRGIDSSSLVMADGSGLSEYNRITPKQMVEILASMWNDPNKEIFYDSLPIAGKDGTLSYRMSGYDVRAKTGSLSGFIALSGYVRTKGGQVVIFSIFTNNHDSSSGRIRYCEDTVVKMIAEFPGEL